MALPPFSQVLKSRDVEDPVNLWLHRPLAYAFVALVHKTPITPNQVTLLAMSVGITAAAFWFYGTPMAMFIGGILLWSSSILDGADGILARAKGIQSELGRALDGVADQVVASVTVIAGFYHIWAKYQDLTMVPWMPVALITALFQVYFYDYYKESYMASLNPSWNGRNDALADTQKKLEDAQRQRAPWIVRLSWGAYHTLIANQIRMVTLTNPAGLRHDKHFPVNNDETRRIYRRYNYWPLQVWTLVSLCPHTYLMAIAAMSDRLDLYLWFRVVPGNLLFFIALIWQRFATARTLRAYREIGAAPEQL